MWAAKRGRLGSVTVKLRTRMKAGWRRARTLVLSAGAASEGGVMAQGSGNQATSVIEKQGSFAVGGTVLSNARHLRQQQAHRRRAEPPRRPSLRLLSGAAERQGTADRHAARRLSVGAELGNDAGRTRGIPDALSAPRLSRSISSTSRGAAAPATAPSPRPSSRRPMTSSSSTSSGSEVAELFRQRPVRSQAGDAEPVLPLGHAQYRSVRCRGDLRRDVGAVRPRSARHSVHPLPGAAGRDG